MKYQDLCNLKNKLDTIADCFKKFQIYYTNDMLNDLYKSNTNNKLNDILNNLPDENILPKTSKFKFFINNDIWKNTIKAIYKESQKDDIIKYLYCKQLNSNLIKSIIKNNFKFINFEENILDKLNPEENSIDFVIYYSYTIYSLLDSYDTLSYDITIYNLFSLPNINTSGIFMQGSNIIKYQDLYYLIGIKIPHILSNIKSSCKINTKNYKVFSISNIWKLIDIKNGLSDLIINKPFKDILIATKSKKKLTKFINITDYLLKLFNITNINIDTIIKYNTDIIKTNSSKILNDYSVISAIKAIETSLIADITEQIQNNKLEIDTHTIKIKKLEDENNSIDQFIQNHKKRLTIYYI